MDYEINESLESLSCYCDKKIGGFKVRLNNDFILFNPSINYNGVTLNPLKVRHTTF